MLGITIRLGATAHQIEAAGQTFDLSRQNGEKLSDYSRRRDRASSKLIGELSSIGYFSKVEEV